MKTRLHFTSSMLPFMLLMGLMLASCSGPASNRLKVKSDNEIRWAIDPNMYGKPPAESVIFKGTWEAWSDVVGSNQQYVLCQTGYADYPAIALNNKVYGDVTVTTLFKPVSGKKDQAAGIIFRIQDKNNYYILRANALNNSVGIYKYVMGNLTPIKEVSVNVSTEKWQELAAEAKGNRLRGFLNGKQLLDVRDETFTSGKVGLWTKTDSVSCFDDVRLIPW